MADFTNPFIGVVPGRKLTKRELTRAVRLSLSAEQEAVHIYEAIADATDDPLAKEGMQDVADEERVHAGEFQRLLSILVADEDELIGKGAAEVNEMREKINGHGTASGENGGGRRGDESVRSVGDLKESMR